MSTLRQIWTDNDYVYVALDDGLDIYNVTSESKIAYVNYNTGFNSVWASDDKIYLATSNAGIKQLSISVIDNAPVVSGGYDATGSLLSFLNEPYITNSGVLYLHGSGDYLACCTTAGVDTMKFEPDGYRSRTITTGCTKCFMTSTGKFYYTRQNGNEWSINRVNTSLTDWSQPDYMYITGSGILQAGIGVNDIFITEGTATDGADNTVFTATTSGAYVIDESDLVYYRYFTI